MALPIELTASGLMGWVERFGAEDQMLLESYFPPRPNEGSDNQVRWDRVDMGREVAGFVPYSVPGKQIASESIESKSIIAPTIREKKRVPGSHIQWMRAPGQTTRAQGQIAINREMVSLRNRIKRRQELLRAQCLAGTMTYVIDGVTHSVSSEIPSAHLNPTNVDWSDSTKDILADLATWVELIEQNGGVSPDKLIIGRSVAGYLLGNSTMQNLLSQNAKEELRSGTVTRIPGLDLDVQVYSKGYINSSGTFVPYIANKGAVLLASEVAGNAAWTVECKSNDARVADSQRGLFLHSWEEEEPPAGVWISAESTAVPVLANGAAVVYQADVTS